MAPIKRAASDSDSGRDDRRSDHTGDRDRGQLLLVGGLTLAVALVTIVLVLNSGIYAHNLASRTDASDENALAVQESVDTMTGRAIDETLLTVPDDIPAQETALDANIDAIRTQVARYQSAQSVTVNVSRASGSTVDGTVVRQTADGNFTSAAGTPQDDWDVVTNVDRLRGFRLDVIRGSLFDIGTVALSDTFTIEISDGSRTWRIRIYNNGAGETLVRTDPPSGFSTPYGNATYPPCRDASGTRTVIDITDARVGGTHCQGLEIFSSLPGELDLTSPLSVRYENAYDTLTGSDSVEGQYRLVVDKTESNVEGARFASEPDADRPTAEAAIYSVRMELFYRSPDLTYRATDIRVAPGEPDD